MKRLGLLCSTLAVVCSSACSSSGMTASPDAAAASTSVEFLAWVDLPRQPETESLSGTYYDESTRTLYALQDIRPSIVPLVATADYRSWTVGSPIALVGRPSAAWDGEGLARARDGTWIAITVETLPLVERFTPTGVYLGAIDTPARFAQQHAGNMGLESLSISPSGNGYLVYANEGALTTDGPIATKQAGTLIRIARQELAGGAVDEHAYRTDTLGAGDGGTLGVSDVTALDDDNLLVLERGYQAGYGNTVRIYAVDLAAGGLTTLDALSATTPVVPKRMVVDLATLPSEGVPNPQGQPNPILDNYEGLALGPKLSDGRRIVFVTSDDNQSDTQVARILVLALPL